MHILLLYLVGITLGRLTSFKAGRCTQLRDFINISAGIVGALFGGLFLARAIGTPIALQSFNIGALLLSAASAALMLTMLTLLRRRFGRGV